MHAPEHEEPLAQAHARDAHEDLELRRQRVRARHGRVRALPAVVQHGVLEQRAKVMLHLAQRLVPPALQPLRDDGQVHRRGKEPEEALRGHGRARRHEAVQLVLQPRVQLQQQVQDGQAQQPHLVPHERRHRVHHRHPRPSHLPGHQVRPVVPLERPRAPLLLRPQARRLGRRREHVLGLCARHSRRGPRTAARQLEFRAGEKTKFVRRLWRISDFPRRSTGSFALLTSALWVADFCAVGRLAARRTHTPAHRTWTREGGLRSWRRREGAGMSAVGDGGRMITARGRDGGRRGTHQPVSQTSQSNILLSESYRESNARYTRGRRREARGEGSGPSWARLVCLATEALPVPASPRAARASPQPERTERKLSRSRSEGWLYSYKNDFLEHVKTGDVLSLRHSAGLHPEWIHLGACGEWAVTVVAATVTVAGKACWGCGGSLGQE